MVNRNSNTVDIGPKPRKAKAKPKAKPKAKGKAKPKAKPRARSTNTNINKINVNVGSAGGAYTGPYGGGHISISQPQYPVPSPYPTPPPFTAYPPPVGGPTAGPPRVVPQHPMYDTPVGVSLRDNLSTLDARVDRLQNIIRRSQIGGGSPLSVQSSGRSRVSMPLVPDDNSTTYSPLIPDNNSDYPRPGFSQDDLELIRLSGWRGDDADAGGDTQTPMSSVSDQSSMPMQAPPPSLASASTLVRRTQNNLRISIPEAEPPLPAPRLPVSPVASVAVSRGRSNSDVSELTIGPNTFGATTQEPTTLVTDARNRRPYVLGGLERTSLPVLDKIINPLFQAIQYDDKEAIGTMRKEFESLPNVNVSPPRKGKTGTAPRPPIYHFDKYIEAYEKYLGSERAYENEGTSTALAQRTRDRENLSKVKSRFVNSYKGAQTAVDA